MALKPETLRKKKRKALGKIRDVVMEKGGENEMKRNALK